MVTFFEVAAQRKIKSSNQLMKLNKLIDWKKVKDRLKGLYKMEEKDQGGPRPYDPLKMFKAILLGQWHNLSDPQLEDSLGLRNDFLLFTGFDLNEPTPDETTLCRFRNKLIENNLHRKLFQCINRQLEEFGLKIENAQAAVLDATVIESAARPRRVYEIQEDREEKAEKAALKKIESKDPDAKWLKKGKKCFFGYKGFVSTSPEAGFIQHVEVESANVSEVRYLPKMLEHLRQEEIYADKGYFSRSNEELLQSEKRRSRVMKKAFRGSELTFWQKQFNKLVSKKRYIVEQCFGTLKRRFNLSRASYMTRLKVEGQLYFKSICFNLLKTVRLCQN